MANDELDTVYLNEQYAKVQAGDAQARNDLIRRAQRRLEKLVHKMLKDYPVVRRWEDSGDVLQNSLLRLLRALENVQPPNTRAFFGLAAEQIRRELIDLARHYKGTYGLSTNLQSGVLLPKAKSQDSAPAHEPVDAQPAPEELDRWLCFHEAVERLPAEEREVFGLTYYHGWTQSEIAELFQRDERTIRRYWKSACAKLKARVAGDAA